MINNCDICLEKQRKIDELQEDVRRLKAELGRQKKKGNDPFGSSTSSSKKPFKSNTEKKERKSPGQGKGTRDAAGVSFPVKMQTG